MRKLFFGLIFILFLSHYSYSQSLSVLNLLDNKHQKCLDKGNNMLLCTQKYYAQMDSLLNVAYKNYRTTLTDSQKQSLKTEQLNWLTSRDSYFRKINKELKTDQGSRDAQMIAMDEKAQFIRERVVYFIKKLKH